MAELASPIVRPLLYCLPASGIATIVHSSAGVASFLFIERTNGLVLSALSVCSTSIAFCSEPSIMTGSLTRPLRPR